MAAKADRQRACGRRPGKGRAGRQQPSWEAGQGRAGQGRAGPGRAGQGRAGPGRAGQGRAGPGRAGPGREATAELGGRVAAKADRQRLAGGGRARAGRAGRAGAGADDRWAERPGEGWRRPGWRPGGGEGRQTKAGEGPGPAPRAGMSGEPVLREGEWAASPGAGGTGWSCRQAAWSGRGGRCFRGRARAYRKRHVRPGNEG
ncbi:hypothetical protein GCM10010112_48010 [Actinoplanes lobatus]|nr:hypothetical protein GCM10010112_48010 [Actinoplanes lobatus]